MTNFRVVEKKFTEWFTKSPSVMFSRGPFLKAGLKKIPVLISVLKCFENEWLYFGLQFIDSVIRLWWESVLNMASLIVYILCFNILWKRLSPCFLLLANRLKTSFFEIDAFMKLIRSEQGFWSLFLFMKRLCWSRRHNLHYASPLEGSLHKNDVIPKRECTENPLTEPRRN